MRRDLFDYSVFAKSDDEELIEFCRYYVDYKKGTHWSEHKIPQVEGSVIKKLSLNHLLRTVNFMRHWMYLCDICSIILSFRSYSTAKVIDCSGGGSVVIKDFKRLDFSLEGRISTIISLVGESL